MFLHLYHELVFLSSINRAILPTFCWSKSLIFKKRHKSLQSKDVSFAMCRLLREGHFDLKLSSPRRRSQLLSPITPLSRHSPAPVETPVTPQLTVLPSPLACVGFSHAIERTTAERVRQLVVWPEQARKSWQRKRLSGPILTEPESGRPFISYTRTEDGASIVTETRILRWMFGRKQITEENQQVDEDTSTEHLGAVEETTEFQLGGQLAVGYITDTTDFSDTDDDDLPCSCMSTSDGMELSGHVPQTPPLDEDKRLKHLSLPTSPRESPGAPNIPISWTRANRRSTISLKSDVEEKVKNWQARPRVSGPKPDRPSRKRCLQLDLRGVDEEDTTPRQIEDDSALDELGTQHHVTGPVYHMDKSGLVTRFSDLLNSASIRMLYSSTFHTANILVETKDIHRAKRLLQGRENSPVKGCF